jgi:nicotinamide mononucleotide transporter
MNTAVASPAPWFGRAWEWKHAGIAGIGSFLLCLAYAKLTGIFAPDFAPGIIDFIGTMTSLWCVWITQKRNVLSLPLGIISAGFMGYFFLQIDLIGQMLLHWVYYLPVQFWAWYMWTRGDDGSELRVSRLTGKEMGIIGALIVVATFIFGNVLTMADTALYTYWDASIVAASVVAMILLSTKKVESWYLWILPVNVSAIGLYYTTGAYMFAALYCLFLVMAFFGLARWNNASNSNAT